MTVYAIAQLRFTDRAAYDRYQARFAEVFADTVARCWLPTSVRRSSKVAGIAKRWY